jgi:hypothetical protein
VGGVVRDSAGSAQIGVEVLLLRPDSTLVSRAFTDHKGFYLFTSVLPGQYALKAESASFIPTLKQNLRIRANTVVNLTLNTLYDLMQWNPQPQRARLQGEDDWAWTMRTTESRPLLRWQEDGSPLLVSDGSAETRRKAQSRRRLKLVAQMGERRFGAAPSQVAMTMLDSASQRRRWVASGEASPEAAGVMDAMLGFRQEMRGNAMGSSSMQTLVAVMNDPQAGQQGLQAVSLRGWESIQILDALEAEAGSDQVVARLGDGSQILRSLPFASLTLHRGSGPNSSELLYRVATSRSSESTDTEDSESMPGPWLPLLSERDGSLVLEHGLHQELGWSKEMGPAEMQLVIYGDSIINPLLEGAGRLSSATDLGQGWMLVDRASGMVRAAGPSYSTTGMLASFQSRLPGGNHIRLSYASGDALVMHAAAKPEDIATILQGVGTRRAQMYALALSGTVDATGTHWRASYRWQPDATVTEVAPFAVNASEPYLNLYIRQPIWTNHDGPASVEAQLDARNLLAEGYQPFLVSDGSKLYFAQTQRSVRGGLAFTF